MYLIPFNQIDISPQVLPYLQQALQDQMFENGYFTQKASALLETLTGAKNVLLTNSATAALELSFLLQDVGPGDEVIMPSFTFVSTANALVLRGATPVFVDIRPDTLNLDENKIEAAITDKTKAIVVVHYAGVGAEMEAILQIARKYQLDVIEDNAQGIFAHYQNQALGSFGRMSALSFHYTKNVTSALGGALCINDESLLERARILWQKGTNRDAFLQGKVDHYTWVDLGSSFAPSELTAAFLLASLEAGQENTSRRRAIWDRYQAAFSQLPARQPSPPSYCDHNAHIYYLILPLLAARQAFMAAMSVKGIQTTSHFEPLHLSPAGEKYGKCTRETLPETEYVYQRLVRLPLYPSLTDEQVDAVIDATLRTFS